MTEFDYDCDGKMSFAEFQKAVEKLKELEEGLWCYLAKIYFIKSHLCPFDTVVVPRRILKTLWLLLGLELENQYVEILLTAHASMNQCLHCWKREAGSFNIWSKSKYICRVILILYFKMYYFEKLPNCETRLWNVKKTEVEVLKVALLPWRYQVRRADKVLVKAGKSLVVAVGQHYLDNIGCGSAQMVFTSLTTPLFGQHWPLSRQPKIEFKKEKSTGRDIRHSWEWGDIGTEN